MPRKVTMADVAERAGVSRTTVSFVLNQKPNTSVSDATKARILEVVAELGYRPNAGARALAARRSEWVGLVTEIVTSPFAVDIIKGAQSAAWADGRFLLIASTDDVDHHAAAAGVDLQERAICKLLEQGVDGLVYAATWHRPIEVPDILREVPAVLVNCLSTKQDLPCIIPDEVGGGHAATQHLVEKGHRRIGLVNLDVRTQAGAGRLEGYRRCLDEAGIGFSPELVVEGDATATGGFEAAGQLIDLPERPTALFCATDRMAMGAYDAIKERGLSIPDDVAVVGFDNQEWISAYLRPALTTVALPFEEMGTLGVETLAALNAGRTVAPVQTVPCPLLERSSA